MLLNLTPAQIDRLIRRLAVDEDAQETAKGEYTVDLYDGEPPISLELAVTKDTVDALAAALLRFDEELDGWYLAERIEDADAIAAAVRAWIDTDVGA